MLRSSLRALTHQTAPPATSSLAVRATVPRSSAPYARSRRALSRTTQCQLLPVPTRAAGCPACRGWQASVASHSRQRLTLSRWIGCISAARRACGSSAEQVPVIGSTDSHAVPSNTVANHDRGPAGGVSLGGSSQRQPQPWTNSVSITRGEVHVWWLHPDKVLT